MLSFKIERMGKGNVSMVELTVYGRLALIDKPSKKLGTILSRTFGEDESLVDFIEKGTGSVLQVKENCIVIYKHLDSDIEAVTYPLRKIVHIKETYDGITSLASLQEFCPSYEIHLPDQIIKLENIILEYDDDANENRMEELMKTMDRLKSLL